MPLETLENGKSFLEQRTKLNTAIDEVNSITDGTSSGDIPVTATGTTTPRSLGDRFTDRINIKDEGVVADGITDISAAFAAAVRKGKPLYVEKGEYFISAKGANTDGILIDNLNVDIDILCDNGAVFISDEIDGDMIRITASSSVEELALNWKWVGDSFDQRNQKNSLVTPYSDQFPPVSVGASNTADGLYMVASYDDAGTEKSAVDTVEISGVTFIGSYDHWTLAGGDSGFFVSGARTVKFRNNKGYGNRDSLGYLSGDDETADLLENIHVSGNDYYHSCNGISVKRGGKNLKIFDNHGFNTLLPISLQYVASETTGGSIYGNTDVNAWRSYRLDEVKNVILTNNVSRLLGHTMANGSADTVVFTYGVGFDMRGCTGCTVGMNTIAEKNPLYISAGFGDGVNLLDYTPTGTNSTNNLIIGNTITGLNDGGNDNSGVGVSNNTYAWNNIHSCNINRFVLTSDTSTALYVNASEGLLVAGDGENRLKFVVTETGDIKTIGTLIVDNLKVVGPQEAAINDSVGGDEQSKINSILAALRSHGLIAI